MTVSVILFFTLNAAKRRYKLIADFFDNDVRLGFVYAI